MEKLNPYLTFPGTCEEAFNFYRNIFGGQFSIVNRFSDISPDEYLLIPEDKMNKIVHIALQLDEHSILTGSDCDEAWCQEVVNGNNVTLSINASSRERADKLFEKLCCEGSVQMQIGDVFWGQYNGICTDKFGITWKINYHKVLSQV